MKKIPIQAYTTEFKQLAVKSSIKGQVDNLHRDWKRGSVSDTQLALGVKDIQKNAKQEIESGLFQISPKCRLL